MLLLRFTFLVIVILTYLSLLTLRKKTGLIRRHLEEMKEKKQEKEEVGEKKERKEGRAEGRKERGRKRKERVKKKVKGISFYS